MSSFQWADLGVALGLVLVLEGLVYSLFPGAARKMAEEVPKMPDSKLRNFGLVLLGAGVFFVWMIRG